MKQKRLDYSKQSNQGTEKPALKKAVVGVNPNCRIDKPEIQSECTDSCVVNWKPVSLNR